MLPISELVRVARTLDSAGSSPLALSAARHWGYDDVKFVRSSATHVFFGSAASATDAVIRLAPRAFPPISDPRHVAQLSHELASVLAPVAPARATTDGCWTVAIRAEPGTYDAACYERAAGTHLAATALCPDQATAWGRGLAALHEAGSRVAPRVVQCFPAWESTHLATAASGLAATDLASVAADVQARVDHLPRDASVYGLVHGDPELDNILWQDQAPTFVDFDEAAHSWFACDVAFALRDVADVARGPKPEDPVVAGFLAGYRRVRPLSAEELSWLPLFGRAHALVSVVKLSRLVAEQPEAQWPDWAHSLHQKLVSVADELRTQLLL